MKTKKLRVALLVTFLCLSSVSNAELIDEWQIRHPRPTPFRIFNTAFGNGVYASVGQYGTIITTSDFQNWDIEYRPEPLENIVFDGAQFVISGYKGDILTSTDGYDWSVYDSGTDMSLSGITYGNGMLVAAGQNGTTAVSSDGMNWQLGSTGTDDWYYGVAYGNGVYVAVSVDDPDYEVSGTIVTSVDGINWTPVTLPAGEPSYLEFWDVAFGNGQFTAVGYSWNGTTEISGVFIMTSTNGTNWTHVDSASLPNVENSNSDWLNSVVYDSENSRWVATGEDELIMTSTDGQNWVASFPMEFGSSDFWEIVVGPVGTTVLGPRGKIFSSQDLVSWEQNSYGSYPALQEIASANGIYITGSSGGQIFRSEDGLTWDFQISRLSGNLRNIVYGNGYWVAGNDSIVAQDTNPLSISQDGMNWNLPTSVPDGFEDSRGLVFGNGVFVALPVGGENSLILSTDAQTWTGMSHPWFTANQASIQIEFGGGQFVAFEGSGSANDEVAVSSNGTDWQIYTKNSTQRFNTAAYGDGRWVFVGLSGLVVSTTDFENWDEQILTFGGNDPVHLEGVAFGAGHWVITGRNHRIWSSTDGVNWEDAFTTYTTGNNGIFHKVTFAEDSFWVVGEQGVIFQSETLSTEELAPPKLTVQRTQDPMALLLTVEGKAGQMWDVLYSPILPAPAWQELFTITLTSDIHSQPAPMPEGFDEGYLQLREPTAQ